MKLALVILCGLLVSNTAWAHPHEWVDWGVGLVVDQKKPVTITAARLELTWDEWLSALILTDFPAMAKNSLMPSDLQQIDAAYGLASPDRASSLTVTFRGQAFAVKPTLAAVRYDGKQATLVYSLALGLTIKTPSEIRVEIYDPTYYADMGIRAKLGGFWVGTQDAAAGSVKYEQDMAHAYYGGSVFPEVVVFTLNP